MGLEYIECQRRDDTYGAAAVGTGADLQEYSWK